MNGNKLDTIKQTAREARSWAQAYAADNMFPEDLEGLCAIASAKLHTMLLNKKIKSELHLAEETDGLGCHVYVFTNGYIVDVTATQFGFKRKTIVRKPRVTDDWYWKKIKSFKTAQGLVNQQKRDLWTDFQVADKI